MLDIANYALEALKKAGADKASCTAVKDRKDEFNIEENKFSLLRTLFDDNLSLKALVGGRKGVSIINKLDKASVDAAVAECITMAKSAEPDAAEDIAPAQPDAPKVFDGRKGGLDREKLFSRTKEFLEQVKDEYPKILMTSAMSKFVSGECTYVNSNGVEFNRYYEYYSKNSMFSAKEGDVSTSFNGYGTLSSSLDTPFMDGGMYRTLLAESEKSLKSRSLEGKFTGKIIMTPACDDMIWYTLFQNFLGDRAMIEGTSRWKDALDTVVADSKLTLSTVPLHPSIVAGECFTSDGFLSRDVEYIKDGVLKSFDLSLYGANKTGKPRSGNTSWAIEVAAGDANLAEMIKGVDKGILLNRFSGGSPGASGDISGVAKNSFLIENGQITDAVQETMISFNILDVLKEIPAISKERVMNGSSILPWCCFDGVTVSGK